jgi:hypothetical protein
MESITRDALAEQGRKGWSEVWDLPSVWYEPNVLICRKGSEVIISVKHEAKKVFTWKDTPDMHEYAKEAMTDTLTPKRSIAILWRKVNPLHTKDYISTLICNRYADVSDMVVGRQEEGKCTWCGARVLLLDYHLIVECINVWGKVPQVMGSIWEILRPHEKKGVRVHRVWGGLRYKYKGEFLWLQWVHPRWISRVNTTVSGWWPLCQGRLPPERI